MRLTLVSVAIKWDRKFIFNNNIIRVYVARSNGDMRESHKLLYIKEAIPSYPALRGTIRQLLQERITR